MRFPDSPVFSTVRLLSGFRNAPSLVNGPDFARLASVPMMKLTPAEMPEDAGSGCLIDFPAKRMLVTVRHVPHGGGDWRVLVSQDPTTQQALYYRPGAFRYVFGAKLKNPKKTTEVEFACVDVPKDLRPLDQITDDPRPGGGVPKLALPASLTDPSPNDDYAFYGLTRWEIDDQFRVHIEQRGEEGLKYVGTDKFVHTFKRPEKYFDYDSYKGCSGAPIMDDRGRLVSLLIGGTEDKRGFEGLNLRMVWSALLIEAGVIG